MAKRGRHRKGGRVTPKGTRPPGSGPSSGFGPSRDFGPPVNGFDATAGFGPPPDRGSDPHLLGDIRRAAATGHPLDLLVLVSTFLTITDPRQRDPFQRGPEPPRMPLDALVATFVDVDRDETSLMLAGIAAMVPDDLMRTRIRRTLASRGGRLPEWLRQIDAPEVHTAIEMVHVLGDGDNIMLGVSLPTAELTVVVYIDHNMGTVVKDAYVVPDDIQSFLTQMRRVADDPDTEWRPLSLADARARIGEGIDDGARSYPPFESDTWPAVRPLVEWVARTMPEGGAGYELQEWSEDEKEGVAEAFLASPFGESFDDVENRSRLDSLLWFGTGYNRGGPHRWSPVNVEIVLADWIPRKIVADVDHLAGMPDVLRSFIRFSHREHGIPAHLTDETLAAVDQWEPLYQELIRSERPQGVDALMERMGFGGQQPEDEFEFGEFDFDEFDYDPKEYLVHAVGSREALDALDDTPLPDEPFDWSGIGDDMHDVIADVLQRCDRACDALFDVEARTACRRFLALMGREAPEVFRRRANIDRTAATVCWIIGKANNLFGYRPEVQELMAFFDLKSPVADRARTMLRAIGHDGWWYGAIDLGRPELLVSSRRAQLIRRRNA